MRTKLRGDEDLLLETRRHWVLLLKPIVAAVLTSVLAGVGFWWREEAGYGGTVLALVALGVLGWRLLERHHDLWAVTDRRVIDEWGVLSANAKESPLDKINNVTYRQSLLGRILGYGSVEIQTAAEMGATVYTYVAGPRLLKDAVTAAQDQQRRDVMALQAHETAAAVQGGVVAPAATADTKICPYCAETIKAKATLCRYCYRQLPA